MSLQIRDVRKQGAAGAAASGTWPDPSTTTEQDHQPPAVGSNATSAVGTADKVGNGTAAWNQQRAASERQQPAEAGAAAAGGGAAPNGVLLAAVRPGERYAFCMTNPPFFETIQQAGLNPHTAHLGASQQPAMKPLDMQPPCRRGQCFATDGQHSCEAEVSQHRPRVLVSGSPDRLGSHWVWCCRQAQPTRWCVLVANRHSWAPWSPTACSFVTAYTGERSLAAEPCPSTECTCSKAAAHILLRHCSHADPLRMHSFVECMRGTR